MTTDPVETLKKAMKVAQFAIAQIPMSEHGWPIDDLRALGEAIYRGDLPLTEAERELGLVFINYAKPTPTRPNTNEAANHLSGDDILYLQKVLKGHPGIAAAVHGTPPPPARSWWERLTGRGKNPS